MLTSIIKINKILLNEDVESKIHEYIKDKKDIKNVFSFYPLAKLLNLSRPAKAVFIHIECYFTTLVETQNFLELDYTFISRILASSGLLITSELEVYNAANEWLSYKIGERSMFAKDLLQKVRLPLLSAEALRFLLNKSSSFTDNDVCVAMIEVILDNNKDRIQNNCMKYYTSRYCNQSRFNLLIYEGWDQKFNEVANTINQYEGTKVLRQKVIPPITERRDRSQAVCLKDQVYVFGGYGNSRELVTSIEKYSCETNTWKVVANMHDKREEFCVCAFMDDIYVIGGAF